MSPPVEAPKIELDSGWRCCLDGDSPRGTRAPLWWGFDDGETRHERDQGLMNMPVLALNFAVNLNCSRNIKSLKKLI